MLILSPGWAFFLPDFNSPPSVSPLSRENKANFLIVLNYQKLWTLWTQGIMLSRKVLCHLIHSPRTFVSIGYFWNSLSQTICLDWHWNEILLISASWVARITGPSLPHLVHKAHFTWLLDLHNCVLDNLIFFISVILNLMSSSLTNISPQCHHTLKVHSLIQKKYISLSCFFSFFSTYKWCLSFSSDMTLDKLFNHSNLIAITWQY
jgi:hypothetical protein